MQPAARLAKFWKNKPSSLTKLKMTIRLTLSKPGGSLSTFLHAAAATSKISLEKTLTVCSLYLPPNTPVSKLSLAELFEQLSKPSLMLGDFNAHYPAWEDSCLKRSWLKMIILTL
ncbi:RNA-directed DNA polymerase from mobile element jockey [Plakobranchus ocellatus]|uniref:RNA-directed DNA polymerase from mobile element jockey n=1 Tax=Plakobranchus ocellatus TaxID=259542 RepID=A0AAV4DR35_9GAST|nr:RNA-directed DNA polymerase from mobile element jockey [Plakobranchus ocellatus]